VRVLEPSRLVTDHTVYACVVGSRAYGLAGPDSDIDRRGVFVVPTALLWSLDKPPTHVDGPAPEQFSWEFERFCALALTGNPTVLECLWSPIVERVTEVGQELLAVRPAFLSIKVAATYGSYARDQMAKLDQHWRRHGEVRWKQAMHMLRLLLAGAHVLRTGEVLVDVSAHREQLLAVKRGELSFEAVRARADRLFDELTTATASSGLPAEPDRAAVDALLIRTRRGAL
jgi:predicted nucleotidyltransferase